MIKATELRIGNILNDQHGDSVTVVRISELIVDLRFEDMIMEDIDVNLCDPVPLTPEWLRILGWTTDSQGDDFHNKPLWKRPSANYEYCESGCFVDNNRHYGEYCDIGHVKYVHQLQNLYFALTGEELAITQPV